VAGLKRTFFQNVADNDMPEKKIFAAAGISQSLDTVLATTLGTNYHSRLKKSNPNLLSEKSLSNNSSKSSSGSSLTLTNNQNNNNANCANGNANQYPHHQFYCSQISQISTSANWNSTTSRNSLCSQKVSVRFCMKNYSSLDRLSRRRRDSL
jgi:hypothetical protein